MSKIIRQRSIEYQAKVVPGVAGPGLVSGKVDRRGGDAALGRAVRGVLKGLVGGLVVECSKPYHRQAIRYDTEDGAFRRAGLSLAVEAARERTKYKCKEHSLVAGLLDVCRWASLVWPERGAERAKVKLEQDVHFNGSKFCASGSVFVEGECLQAEYVSEFIRIFPALERIASRDAMLVQVGRWQETVTAYTTKSGAGALDWLLVSRWDGDTLLESELSFKVVKAKGEQWNRETMRLASRIYNELAENPVFIKAPPVFLFVDPVPSVGVVYMP